MDLNSLFDNAVDKLKFYEQAKRGKLEVKEYEDINGTAVLNYFERLRDHKVLPIPNFVTFEKNTMYLSSRTITKQ